MDIRKTNDRDLILNSKHVLVNQTAVITYVHNYKHPDYPNKSEVASQLNRSTSYQGSSQYFFEPTCSRTHHFEKQH